MIALSRSSRQDRPASISHASNASAVLCEQFRNYFTDAEASADRVLLFIWKALTQWI